MSIAPQTRRCSVLQVNLLTKNARRLYDLGNRVLPGLTESTLRKTFFGHFCAGTDQDTIVPTVNKLKDAGIGAILDYAAEADVSEADQDANTSQASQKAAAEEAASQISEINKVPWHKRARAVVPEIASVASNWARDVSSESMTQPVSFIDPSFNRPTAAVRDRLSVPWQSSAGCQ